jgi:hypothetical protein
MDEKNFLSTRRPIHQSKRLALSFPLHFFFSAAELIQAFYRQITAFPGTTQSHSSTEMIG